MLPALADTPREERSEEKLKRSLCPSQVHRHILSWKINRTEKYPAGSLSQGPTALPGASGWQTTPRPDDDSRREDPAQCLSLVPLPPNTSRVAIFRQATMTATQDAPARTRVHNGWGEEDAGWVTTWYRLVSSRVGSLPASATVVPACGRSTSPLVREPLSSCSARRRPGALGDTEAGDRGTCRNEKKKKRVGEREEGKGWGGGRERR